MTGDTAPRPDVEQALAEAAALLVLIPPDPHDVIQRRRRDLLDATRPRTKEI